MTVSVYTLLIREEPDDTEGTQVRIVAASLTEAVALAGERFGAGSILAVEQTDDPALAKTHGSGAEAGNPDPSASAAFIAAQTPDLLTEPTPHDADAAARASSAALAYVHPASSVVRIAAPTIPVDPAVGSIFDTDADDAPPDPLPGPWRPTRLLWAGALAGLIAFVAWVNFGHSPRDRFVTASAVAVPAQPGLPIEGEAPPGGVIQATGVSLRPGRASDSLGDTVGQTISSFPDEQEGSGEISHGEGEVDDDTLVAIGTVVGEIFSRWPQDENVNAAPAPAPRPPSSSPSWPRAQQPPPPLREPGLLRRWYIEVRRADRVTETLTVNATSAEHALEIVYGRPDHIVVVKGPSTELTW